MATKDLISLGTGSVLLETVKAVDTSAGAGDAGKIPLLDASGQIDASMVAVTVALNDPWQYVALGSNFTHGTVTLTNVTGMSFTATANVVYEVEVFGAFQSAATTTGIALGLDIPSGTVIGLGINSLSANTLTGWEQNADAAVTGASSGVRATSANIPLTAKFLVAVSSTGGTVQLRVRSEIASSNVVLQGGQFFMKYRAASTATTEPWSSTRFSPVNTISGTSYTLLRTDAGKHNVTTNSSAVTITVPPQSSVSWPDYAEIQIEQTGTGQVTIAAGSGVTVSTTSSYTLKSSERYAVLLLKRRASDVWTLTGEREPV